MDFTNEERAAWHEARRQGNDEASWSEGRVAGVCLHCGNPFGINAGVVTADAALCDVCNGD